MRQHISGHSAVCRQLAPRNAEQAIGTMGNGMLSRGGVGRVLAGASGSEGTDATPRGDDIVHGQPRVREAAIHRLQQIRDIGPRRPDIVGARARRAFSGTNDGVASGREHEHHASIKRRHDRDGLVIAHPVAGHGNV